jgi:hypothetical protein
LISNATVSTHEQNLDDKQKRHVVTLHSDPTNSDKGMCRTLGISKATPYRYLAVT